VSHITVRSEVFDVSPEAVTGARFISDLDLIISTKSGLFGLKRNSRLMFSLSSIAI